ncbi:MAG: amino acid ABC transporter substrate-binding protein [Thermodesulfobacteriota bacterium]
MWRFIALGVTVVVLTVMGTCAPQAAEKGYKIGVSVALTGIVGADGRLVKDAYTFWAETVNARGGIEVKGKKYPVELIFHDDKSTPAVSAKLIEKLISDEKVDLLLGGFGSEQVFAGSAVAEKYKYPLISGAASSNKLFERGFKYYFSTLGRATEEVRGCVEVFTSVQPRPKTIAIVGANILFTSLACEGFRKYAKERGFDVVHYELFPIDLQDYNSMLLKVKEKNPDVLLVGSHMLVAMKVVKAMKEIDFSPRAVAFSYGPTVPKFVEELGKDAEYIIAASEWTPNLPYKDDIFGTAADLNRKYKERFGRQPDFVEAASIGGAVAQQKVIEKLGLAPPLREEDRVALMKGLHEIDMMTCFGRIHFDQSGANADHPPVAVQIQKGKLVNVFPADAAEAPPLYPMPPWKKR